MFEILDDLSPGQRPFSLCPEKTDDWPPTAASRYSSVDLSPIVTYTPLWDSYLIFSHKLARHPGALTPAVAAIVAIPPAAPCYASNSAW